MAGRGLQGNQGVEVNHQAPDIHGANPETENRKFTMANQFNASDAGPTQLPEDPSIGVIEDILDERERQKKLALGGDTNKFDQTNTRNDWIAYVNAYTGRAAQKVFRNDREKCDFRENMVKAAAVIVAAIEAHDQGFC